MNAVDQRLFTPVSVEGRRTWKVDDKVLNILKDVYRDLSRADVQKIAGVSHVTFKGWLDGKPVGLKSTRSITALISPDYPLLRLNTLSVY